MPISTMRKSFHQHYLTLVEFIESNFPVASWKSADVDVWPLARMDLYLDMFLQSEGGARPPMDPIALRYPARFSRPFENLWKSRNDLAHFIWRPKRADAMFLGNGVFLDRINLDYVDRHSEPVMAALEGRGLRSFLMQDGDVSHLPWLRPTFPANLMAVRGELGRFSSLSPANLPELCELQAFLRHQKVNAPSLSESVLLRRANTVAATAKEFESVIRIVRPRFGFVVAYYAGLGPAFVLACRRQRVLSIDLQHCPQEGIHKAYGWNAVPAKGFSVLPNVFWNWSEQDVIHIKRWTARLMEPWHRSLYGGVTQLASFLNDDDPQTAAWDAKFIVLAGGSKFDREILVALQTVRGFRDQWDALAATIEAAPANWRWWVRRHPAAGTSQDAEYKRLISLRRPNVVIDASSSIPLAALLRHMTAVISQFSGTSAEAAAFGVPAYFLSGKARELFQGLITRGAATVIGLSSMTEIISRLPKKPSRSRSENPPSIDDALTQLEAIAGDYAEMQSAR